MFIWVIIFLLICIVFLFHHGIEIFFDANGWQYEFRVYYLLFGKIRFFQIKHIKMQKDKKPKQSRINLGIIRYLKARIDITYTVATANLTPSYAIASSMFCSLLEAIDDFSNINVVQNIYYTNWGYYFNLKVSTSILNILISLIKYKVKTNNKLFIKKG